MNADPTALGAATISDSIAIGPDAWTVIIVDAGTLDEASSDLVSELADALPAGEDVYRVNLATSDSAMDTMASFGPRGVAVVTGIEVLGVSALEGLDARRDALRAARLVIVCTDAGASLLRRHAPNWWSWIGGRCYRLSRAEGTMDVERRLASLRESYGFDDAELARRVSTGDLALDPVVTEWLILSGQVDRLGH